MEYKDDDRPTILRSVPRDQFERLVAEHDAPLLSALAQGSADGARAEADVQPPMIESNLRFA
jgi:hypothetical protein